MFSPDESGVPTVAGDVAGRLEKTVCACCRRSSPHQRNLPAPGDRASYSSSSSAASGGSAAACRDCRLWRASAPPGGGIGKNPAHSDRQGKPLSPRGFDPPPKDFASASSRPCVAGRNRERLWLGEAGRSAGTQLAAELATPRLGRWCCSAETRGHRWIWRVSLLTYSCCVPRPRTARTRFPCALLSQCNWHDGASHCRLDPSAKIMPKCPWALSAALSLSRRRPCRWGEERKGRGRWSAGRSLGLALGLRRPEFPPVLGGHGTDADRPDALAL
jgi:hypothetical protein